MERFSHYRIVITHEKPADRIRLREAAREFHRKSPDTERFYHDLGHNNGDHYFLANPGLVEIMINYALREERERLRVASVPDVLRGKSRYHVPESIVQKIAKLLEVPSELLQPAG